MPTREVDWELVIMAAFQTLVWIPCVVAVVVSRWPALWPDLTVLVERLLS